MTRAAPADTPAYGHFHRSTGDALIILPPLPQPADTALVIAGLALPSESPLFLGTLAIHVLAGLTAVLAGLLAMLSPKRAGRHPFCGHIPYRALAVVFVSNLLLAAIRWPHDTHLVVLGALAMAAAYLGRRARRRGRPGWRLIHIPWMGAAYALLLIAFYVDNGPQIPVWRSLPHYTYWLVPAAVAVPLILAARRRWDRPGAD